MFAEFEDDEDDYDAVEETPVVVGKSNGAPAVPGVVVPTVATTTATAAAQASQPTPSPVVVSVPSVAVPSMTTAAVPAVATLAAAVATAKHVAKPRTVEERGKILRFTDLSHAAKVKRSVPAPSRNTRKRKTTFSTHDDVFEEDDEVEDTSEDEEDEEMESDGEGKKTRKAKGSDDGDDDDASASDSDGKTNDDSTQHDVNQGDGYFQPPKSHLTAEHVEWEDGIAWGDDSESEEEEVVTKSKKNAPKPSASVPVVPAKQPAVTPAPEPSSKPKKMVVRFGCKPVVPAGSNEPKGDGGSGGGGSGGPNANAPSAPMPGVTSREMSSAGATTSETTKKAPTVVTSQTRGWWGDLPDTPLDQGSVPFSRHAQFTRLWGDATEAVDDKKNASATTQAPSTSNTPETTSAPSQLRSITTSKQSEGFGVFGLNVNGDVTFVASQPGAGAEILWRRNKALTKGEWLEDVVWDMKDRKENSITNKSYKPQVRIDPNDPNMVLRSYEPEDETNAEIVGEETKAHVPWQGALATITPGRRLPQVTDLDAFLNISLDRDDEEEGSGKRRQTDDLKKDKGLVGRPGRMEGVYNTGVVSGPPIFAPANHVKLHPKPPTLFAPPPYMHRHKVGLALNLGGSKTQGDDKFAVVVKSLTCHSESVKISVRPFDTIDALLRRVRKKWIDLVGVLEAHFPEGDVHKAHVAACEAAKAEGRDLPRAPCLDPKATLEQCGIKRRVPEPLIYVVAPELFMLDEHVVSEQRPAAVAAAQHALARAMGEETAEEAKASAKAEGKKTAEEIAAAAAAVAAADPAEATANAMTKPSDLSATNGRILLVQYAEANPALVSKPGMGAKRVTYYKRRTQGDTAGRSLTQGGKRLVVDLRPEAPSPFLGELTPGQPQESLETTTFRAPMFQRRIGSDEGLFLLIRSPHGGFTMREVTEYFVLGQQEPHIEVFQPNTDRCRDFEERAINAAVIFSLVKQRSEKVPEEDMRVKVSDIERQFNRAILDKDIRRRIRRKIILPLRPPGQRRKAADEYDDDADEFELNPSYRFEDDLMLHRMCTPEDVVAYESMRAALARLQMGRDKHSANRIRKLAGTSQTQALQAFQATQRGATPAQREGLTDLELLLALQPWAQTTEFLAAVGGRAVLHLDASRKLREKTGKYYHYVRRQPPKDPEGAAVQPKIKPGTVTGTDADLRKLTMPQTERILTGFGVAMSQIKSLHRWKRIGLIRELSGAATADQNAAHSGLSRFARSLRVGIQQQMTEQRQSANKIFNHVRKTLLDKRQRGLRAFQRASTSAGADSDNSDDFDSDSDDDDDDEDSDSEPDSLADELEQGMDEDTSGKAPDEDEERRELEEMRAMMDTSGGSDGAAGGTAAPRSPTVVPSGKKLVLKRVVTKTYPDGRVEKIEDDVAADVGDAWMRDRKFKADGKTVDLDASRESVMKILYPHGVDPPAYVAGGTVGGGGGGAGGSGMGDPVLARTIKAPNFVGTADQKAELLRLRKRKMELLRRRKKKAEQLRAEAGVSQQDLAAMAEKAEKADAEESGSPKKLKLALSFKLSGSSGSLGGSGAGPSRFKKESGLDDFREYGDTKKTKGTTSRFRGTATGRDGMLASIAEGLAMNPMYVAFSVPVTKKALPDYHKFVTHKMDLQTIARNAKKAGGYASVESWLGDVKQILTNSKLYHEADEDVMIRVPQIVFSAEQLVKDAEKALEERASELKTLDPTFDLDKVLGRATGGEGGDAMVE